MPLKCDEIYHFLQAYLDGELGPAEERKLEAHVRLCPSCKKKLFSLQRLITSLESIDEVGPEGDFTKRLLDRLPDDARRRLKSGRGSIWRRFRGRWPKG